MKKKDIIGAVLGVTGAACIVAGFVGLASMESFETTKVEASLSACQAQNADLRGKVKALTDEQVQALRNLDYLKGCPETARKCLNETVTCMDRKLWIRDIQNGPENRCFKGEHGLYLDKKKETPR